MHFECNLKLTGIHYALNFAEPCEDARILYQG